MYQRRTEITYINYKILNPALEFLNDPSLLIKLGSGIKEKQKAEEYLFAAGLMVWLHTIRSVGHPSLRVLGRSLWEQLARGMPYVPELMSEGMIVRLLEDLYPSMALDIDGYEQFPEGLTPSPIG